MPLAQTALDFPPPITLRAARAARDVGIERVTAATELRAPSWASVAYQYLALYARRHEYVNPELLYDEAMAWGLSAPKDARAFGGVYMRAVHRGLIERSDLTYQRRRGHGSVGVLWRSKVFVAPNTHPEARPEIGQRRNEETPALEQGETSRTTEVA